MSKVQPLFNPFNVKTWSIFDNLGFNFGLHVNKILFKESSFLRVLKNWVVYHVWFQNLLLVLFKTCYIFVFLARLNRTLHILIGSCKGSLHTHSFFIELAFKGNNLFVFDIAVMQESVIAIFDQVRVKLME